MKKYYFCFDVGGTFMKGAVIDDKNKIVYKDKVETNLYFKYKDFGKVFLDLIKLLEKGSKLSIKKCSGVGCGIPGLVDEKKGFVKYINSIDLHDYDLNKFFKKITKAKFKVANDAECAGLAEYKLGAGKGYKNFLMVTLGTGVGTTIILNGIRLRSIAHYAGEYGHNFIYGNDVYFEDLASCRGLINMTKEYMKKDKKSKMWKTYNLNNVSGKTVFDYLSTDKTARKLFNAYIEKLGTGITNLYNILTPEVIAIGGGISSQKDRLIKPLKEYVDKHIFVKSIGVKSNIKVAKLTNDAGILGAKLLFDE